MTPKSRTPAPEGPAKIHAGHVRDRQYVEEIRDGKEIKRVIAPGRAWRTLTPLEQAYDKNRLAGGSQRYTALERFEAGKRYARLFAESRGAGKDSTQAMNISGSVGGAGVPEAQCNAIRQLITVESYLGRVDREIVRLVCGERAFPSEAVREASGHAEFVDAILPRFRESLDGLIEAFEKAQKHPGRFNVKRET